MNRDQSVATKPVQNGTDKVSLVITDNGLISKNYGKEEEKDRGIERTSVGKGREMCRKKEVTAFGPEPKCNVASFLLSYYITLNDCR